MHLVKDSDAKKTILLASERSEKKVSALKVRAARIMGWKDNRIVLDRTSASEVCPFRSVDPEWDPELPQDLPYPSPKFNSCCTQTQAGIQDFNQEGPGPKIQRPKVWLPGAETRVFILQASFLVPQAVHLASRLKKKHLECKPNKV